jgi:HPt (histidine-containing phosphotransfer) domain-containing protein
MGAFSPSWTEAEPRASLVRIGALLQVSGSSETVLLRIVSLTVREGSKFKLRNIRDLVLHSGPDRSGCQKTSPFPPPQNCGLFPLDSSINSVNGLIGQLPAAGQPGVQGGLLDVPLFDAAQIASLCDALGEEDLRDMLLDFPDAATEAFQNVATAVRSSDLEGARHLAHTLKGLASSFGAARLAEIARELELEAPSIVSMMQRMPVLTDAIDATLAALPDIVRAPSGTKP